MSSLRNWTNSNLYYALLFSGISYLFSLISFNLPFIEGANSDLREIPLLICLFFIKNPLYLFVVCISGLFATPLDGSMMSTYTMHLIGLFGIWHLHDQVISQLKNKLLVAVGWLISVIVYYLVLLLPVMIITNWIAGLNQEMGFIEFYFNMIKVLPFEIITTAVIVTLYAYQRELQNELKNHIAQLEEKNNQLKEYAFLNSHLLRAPLAKILGFIQLCKQELNSSEQQQILEKLKESCEEFDKTVNVIGKVVANNKVDQIEIEQLKEEIRSINKKEQ